MHTLHLCDDKFVKMGLQAKFQEQLDEDIKKHSDLIKTYFEKIKNIFTQQSAENLIETYKTQINSMILKNNKQITILVPAQVGTQNNLLKQTQANSSSNDVVTAMPFYQCLLGSIEALTEHFFSIGSYK